MLQNLLKLMALANFFKSSPNVSMNDQLQVEGFILNVISFLEDILFGQPELHVDEDRLRELLIWGETLEDSISDHFHGLIPTNALDIIDDEISYDVNDDIEIQEEHVYVIKSDIPLDIVLRPKESAMK